MEIKPMKTSDESVNTLLRKAANSEKSEDSMRYSQAALNCAHALQVMAQIQSLVDNGKEPSK